MKHNQYKKGFQTIEMQAGRYGKLFIKKIS